MTTSQVSDPLPSTVGKDKFKPWKTIGYRGFSAFLASDTDFLIFRRFGTLNARILLFLQDEITSLEEELERLELFHASPEAADVHNGSFRQEAFQTGFIIARMLSSMKNQPTFVIHRISFN